MGQCQSLLQVANSPSYPPPQCLREGEWQFLRWFPNKARTDPAVPAPVPALVPAVPALVPGAGSRSSRAGSQSIYSTRTIRQHGPPRADLTKTTTTHVQRHMPTVRGELQSSDGGRPAGAQLYLRVLLVRQVRHASTHVGSPSIGDSSVPRGTCLIP